MTAAGWHPDPHGRAVRRYHDGSRWTEHVSDATGAVSVDPEGADLSPGGPAPDRPAPVADVPPPGIVIGAPPPRRAPAPPEPAPVEPTEPTGPTSARPASARPASARPASARPPSAGSADATQVVRPEDLAADPSVRRTTPATPHAGPDATAVIPVGALDPEATGVVRPEDVGARPVDATQVTRIPADLLAAGPDATGPLPVGAAPAARARRPSALSPGGVLLAVLGLVLGAVSLFALPWATGGGAEASFLDLRRAVVAAGPDIGAPPIALLVVGGWFALGVGGVVALGRALGAAPVRLAAVAVVVLGLASLTLLGLGAEVDPATATAGSAPDGVPGEVVVDEDGAAVLDEDGTPVTVPQPAPDAGFRPTGGADEGDDRLRTGVLLGVGFMGLSALLGIVGLLARGRTGHTLASAALAVTVVWAGAGVGILATDEQLGDLGTGAYGFVVATIFLAVAAALPAADPTA